MKTFIATIFAAITIAVCSTFAGMFTDISNLKASDKMQERYLISIDKKLDTIIETLLER